MRHGRNSFSRTSTNFGRTNGSSLSRAGKHKFTILSLTNENSNLKQTRLISVLFFRRIRKPQQAPHLQQSRPAFRKHTAANHHAWRQATRIQGTIPARRHPAVYWGVVKAQNRRSSHLAWRSLTTATAAINDFTRPSDSATNTSVCRIGQCISRRWRTAS